MKYYIVGKEGKLLFPGMVEASDMVNGNLIKLNFSTSPWDPDSRPYKWALYNIYTNTIKGTSKTIDKIFDSRCGIIRVKFARVPLYGYLDQNGDRISEEVFDKCRDFKEDFAAVYKEGQGWNFIDKNGKYISKRWFLDCDDMHLKEARVQTKLGTWRTIGSDGELLDKETDDVNCGFYVTFYADDNGKERLGLVNKYNVRLRIDGMLDTFYDNTNECAFVKIKNKGWNIVGHDGKFLSKEFFKRCPEFDNNKLAVVVRMDGSQNYLRPDGTLLLRERPLKCSKFKNGFAVVQLRDDRTYYIKPDGTRLVDKQNLYFTKCEPFNNSKYAYAEGLVARTPYAMFKEDYIRRRYKVYADGQIEVLDR